MHFSNDYFTITKSLCFPQSMHPIPFIMFVITFLFGFLARFHFLQTNNIFPPPFACTPSVNSWELISSTGALFFPFYNNSFHTRPISISSQLNFTFLQNAWCHSDFFIGFISFIQRGSGFRSWILKFTFSFPRSSLFETQSLFIFPSTDLKAIASIT